MRLQGKVTVITGAASGIGFAIAKRFVENGANIVAGDWNAQRLKDAVVSIKAKGGKIVGLQGDIAERKTAEDLIDLAINTYGGVDVLCNNAGVMDYMHGVDVLSDEIWRRVLGINLDGPMFTCRRAIQHMLKHGGGSIINIVSIAGMHGGAAGCAYTAAKHGLLGLTRSTAWMYAKKDIRSNAICPGATKTNIKETMPEERIDPVGLERASGFHVLAPSELEPIDVAELALFLASDESRKINGAIITADGGWSSV